MQEISGHLSCNFLRPRACLKKAVWFLTFWGSENRVDLSISSLLHVLIALKQKTVGCHLFCSLSWNSIHFVMFHLHTFQTVMPISAYSKALTKPRCYLNAEKCVGSSQDLMNVYLIWTEDIRDLLRLSASSCSNSYIWPCAKAIHFWPSFRTDRIAGPPRELLLDEFGRFQHVSKLP